MHHLEDGGRIPPENLFLILCHVIVINKKEWKTINSNTNIYINIILKKLYCIISPNVSASVTPLN